jgi:hypothetical protein
MNLEHLRTPNPLNEFDYAAVRARVHSKLAERRRWWVVFRFASAFAMVVLAMLTLLPSKPVTVPAAVPRAHVVTAALSGHIDSGAPRHATAEGSGRHIVRRRKSRRIEAVTELARIEIHTADPDIRIIWIVPKENS